MLDPIGSGSRGRTEITFSGNRDVPHIPPELSLYADVGHFMKRCAGQKITGAPSNSVARVQLLCKTIWRQHKGRYAHRVPAHYSAIGTQHRSQDRPMLSNTSCSALLAPGSSAAASLASPP